ncbi:AraC-like ligand-binding domain-containing protein [Rhodococcus tibetensis]|uniref:Helix-turn-helix domain-containing protein n=1 Tax=Rhodococcus tibetensis TaxID=2965064 RepID=A0ABT1QJT8_9NOCA|nr:helix-turn-helix domain-containing protein [Rhodococcus sp. FXJ9.536]MCQ4122564.1 helix-turn-helix domain-containing protein [Rhodococcus sp. FXJ9.536]
MSGASEVVKIVDLEAFRATVVDSFVPLDTSTEAGEFEGSIRRIDLGSVQFSEVVATAHTVRRTPRTIRASDPGYYKVGLQVRGYCVLTQDEREAALTPGDLAIYDTTRPYQLSFDDRFRMLVMMFPRTLLRVPESGIAQLTARKISGRQGLATVVAPFLQGLGRDVFTTTPSVAAHLNEAVLDLLAAAFAEQLQLTDSLPPETRHQAMLFRIHSFIESNLSDPELSVARIAAAHHVSTRQLQKLFEAENSTVSGWIRQRRLEQSRRDLSDPHYSHLPVATIGARWGFTEATHFSRLFKANFGLTPGSFRTE